MSVLSIEVEVMIGTDIKEAVRDAVALCNKLGLAYVGFKFNGIRVSVGKNTTPTGFLKEWDEASEHLVVNYKDCSGCAGALSFTLPVFTRAQWEEFKRAGDMAFKMMEVEDDGRWV